MAHNINLNSITGEYSFFSVKERAWHGLGTVVDSSPNSVEAIKLAGLDYTVEKRNIFKEDEASNNFRSIDRFKATVRTDTDPFLGIVGERYRIVQNCEAFTFFDSILDGNDGIIYETAGALGNGERIFITAKLSSYILVGKDDLIENYLFLTNSHDGTSGIVGGFTPVRVVCNNTLNMALRSLKNSICIRHTENAIDKLKFAHKLMGVSNQLSKELEGIFNSWTKVSIRDEEVKRLIQMAMAPNIESLSKIQNDQQELLSVRFNNLVENVMEYAGSHSSQQDINTRGTLYGCFNAVTGFYQNMKKFDSDSKKLDSILNGTAQERSQKCFDLCLDFAKIGKASLMN